MYETSIKLFIYSNYTIITEPEIQIRHPNLKEGLLPYYVTCVLC